MSLSIDMLMNGQNLVILGAIGGNRLARGLQFCRFDGNLRAKTNCFVLKLLPLLMASEETFNIVYVSPEEYCDNNYSASTLVPLSALPHIKIGCNKKYTCLSITDMSMVNVYCLGGDK